MPLLNGDAVHVDYNGSGTRFRATITGSNDDGSYRVKYSDGEVGNRVLRSLIFKVGVK